VPFGGLPAKFSARLQLRQVGSEKNAIHLAIYGIFSCSFVSWKSLPFKVISEIVNLKGQYHEVF
jgi:hypothetical protein